MSSPDSRPDLAGRGGPALREVLGRLLGLSVTEVQPVDSGAPEALDDRLLGTVKLSGEGVTGTVHLGIPRGFAELAIVRLSGGAPSGPIRNTELEDVVGELCNMLAGRVAAQWRGEGYSCGLGLPEVVRESDRPPEREPDADRSRTDWSCQGHRLTLEIRLRQRPT